MKLMRERMEASLKGLQRTICDALAAINQHPFQAHPWTSKRLNGSGSANIFSEGVLLEKGGVSTSTVRGAVFGEMLKMLSEKQLLDSSGLKYFATGLSIVLHPHSPLVPSIHANYRYFEIEDAQGQVIAWFFGGGTDLTPYYLYEEDAVHFHRVLRQACDKTEIGLYAKLKKDADEYFYLPHRKEHRGIGGIFSLRMAEKPIEQVYQWTQNCAHAFLECYLPIVEKRMHEPFSEAQKKWQLIRRGRYVEFNLMCDVGTHFGLKSGGNVENIFMSLPPNVVWEFNHQPESESAEEKLLHVIKHPREWI